MSKTLFASPPFTPQSAPSSCSETVGVFSLLPQPRGKVQYPFVAAAAPPVRTNAALPYLFILKEEAPVRDHYLYESLKRRWCRHGVFQLWHLAMLLHCRGCFSGGQTGVWPALTHAHTPHIVHVLHLAQVSRGVCVCVELRVWICACMCGGVLARWPDAVCWPCPALINML